jgi:hypothetical protein
MGEVVSSRRTGRTVARLPPSATRSYGASRRFPPQAGESKVPRSLYAGGGKAGKRSITATMSQLKSWARIEASGAWPTTT